MGIDGGIKELFMGARKEVRETDIRREAANFVGSSEGIRALRGGLENLYNGRSSGEALTRFQEVLDREGVVVAVDEEGLYSGKKGELYTYDENQVRVKRIKESRRGNKFVMIIHPEAYRKMKEGSMDQVEELNFLWDLAHDYNAIESEKRYGSRENKAFTPFVHWADYFIIRNMEGSEAAEEAAGILDRARRTTERYLGK